MKRTLAILLVICMMLSAASISVFAADEVEPRFVVDPMKALTFTDVADDQWYGANNEACIKTATELGIMGGMGDGLFCPDAQLKLSEAIKMAAVVCSVYSGDNAKFVQGEPWYGVYVDYAIEKGIVKSGEFADYNAVCTRAQAAYIFAGAIPADGLTAASKLTPPDLAAGAQYAEEIIALYKAGVLQGNDTAGNFGADGSFTRAQAAAIISRLCIAAGAYQTGVAVTEASKEDISGEHGAAYKAAGYKATFTYVAAEENIEYVRLSGSLNFYSEAETKLYAEHGYQPNNAKDADYFTSINAYNYREGMFPTTDNCSYDMEEVAEGVYSISIPLPQNAGYSYRFTTNNSTAVEGPGGGIEFDVGSAATAPDSLRYYYPADEAYQGSYVTDSVQVSGTNGDTMPMRIYLPYNYNESKTYKSLYILHGKGGDENSWFDGCRAGNVMDNLAAEGVDDIIVIALNHTVCFDSFSDSQNNSLAPGMRSIAYEVVPYVESKYPVSTAVEDRAMIGLSAGASGTTIGVQTVPEAFGYMGIIGVGREFPFTKDQEVTEGSYRGSATPEAMSKPVVAFYCGNMDKRTPATQLLHSNLSVYNSKTSFEIIDGAHDNYAFRGGFLKFVLNVAWK